MRIFWNWLIAAAAVCGAVDFARDVRPILELRCAGCHGAGQQMGKLRLDSEKAAAGAARRVGEMTASGKMPPAGPLPAAELAVLQAWVAGARPWSFAPLARSSGGVDVLIRKTLAEKGLAPSAEAGRRTLARRLYLDLIGLPPAPAEMDAFLADARPDAYARLVDSLLASPHFGEKWARLWLDLARYADSEGGVQDYARPFAWRYRDWVIQAFNNDMPFDRFTVAQFAGDPVGMGFHRNTITSREGGVELDRIRFEQLLDRTSTVGTVWLGLTIGCAQCHDHKYDPVTQRDFYSLMAFFENAEEADVEPPQHPDYRAARDRLVAAYGIAETLALWEDGVRDAMANPGRRPNWDVSYDSFSKLVDHGRRTLLKKPEARTAREQDSLVDYFAKSSAGAIGKEKYDALKLKELSAKLQRLDEQFPRRQGFMTLADGAAGTPTHVRIRGNWADKGAAVTPDTPASLPPMAPGQRDRKALAEWLVSKENPLTARVTVNRIWQELFGQGLVRTSEDFGAQGERPSHPELLDWLAGEFQDNGWSLKRTIRLVVMSATYRQTSVVREELAAVDPSNTLLARQSRLRLPAEGIRDAALRVSGLLNPTIGGESIRPPQPDGVADLQYSMKWEETRGREKYRRGLYIFLQRTAAYPLLMNFDAPDRTVSCSRRPVSNTPLQPLNLMNDPVFVEAAEALAARIEAAPEAERVDLAFALCFGRPPSGRERDAVLTHVSKRGWFGASRALLNTDEFLTRE